MHCVKVNTPTKRVLRNKNYKTMRTKRFCVACNNHYETLTVVQSFDTIEEAKKYACDVINEFDEIDEDIKDYNHHAFWFDVYDTEVAGVEVVVENGFLRVAVTEDNEEFPIVYTTSERYAEEIDWLSFRGEYTGKELEQLKRTYSRI